MFGVVSLLFAGLALTKAQSDDCSSVIQIMLEQGLTNAGQALELTGLIQGLVDGTEPNTNPDITFVIPSNEAFVKFAEEQQLGQDEASVVMLRDTLFQHIAQGVNPSSALTNGEELNTNCQSLSVELTDGEVSSIVGPLNTVEVQQEIPACGAVLYVIDDVLQAPSGGCNTGGGPSTSEEQPEDSPDSTPETSSEAPAPLEVQETTNSTASDEPAPSPDVPAEPSPSPEVAAEPAPSPEVAAEPATSPDVSADPSPSPSPDVPAEPAPSPQISVEPSPSPEPAQEETMAEDSSDDDNEELTTTAVAPASQPVTLPNDFDLPPIPSYGSREADIPNLDGGYGSAPEPSSDVPVPDTPVSTDCKDVTSVLREAGLNGIGFLAEELGMLEDLNNFSGVFFAPTNGAVVQTLRSLGVTDASNLSSEVREALETVLALHLIPADPSTIELSNKLKLDSVLVDLEGADEVCKTNGTVLIQERTGDSGPFFRVRAGGNSATIVDSIDEACNAQIYVIEEVLDPCTIVPFTPIPATTKAGSGDEELPPSGSVVAVSEVDNSCGAYRQPCCEDETCQLGFMCQPDGTCFTPVCETDSFCQEFAGSWTYCVVDEQNCNACGGDDEPCCPTTKGDGSYSAACRDGSTCSDNNKCTLGEDSAIETQTVVPSCKTAQDCMLYAFWTICREDLGHCNACGEPDQVCCTVEEGKYTRAQQCRDGSECGDGNKCP